jgi:ABC-type polar amino acid transport system ATPase subunit
VIRVQELTKSFAGAPVLRGVSFDVDEGGLVAVLGASGAGKTTLLRCLVGLEQLDSGSISVDGVEMRDARTLRGRMGLVFQSFELFPHLSVLENCTLAPKRVQRVAADEADRRAARLLGEVGLADKQAAYPDHLSGGQRQRVAIARALAMEPRVLLYDEPTSALDATLRAELRDTLQRVRATGVTQLIVTHDLAFVRACAEEVVVLDAGRVAETGFVRDVFEAPRSDATRRLLAEIAPR